MTSGLLLAAGTALLLAGAVLFTNAVEWLGRALRLGEGAVGSVLAAVGTALPESLIPLVAVVGGGAGGGEVAVGAIVGAPFLLATIALALVAASAFAFRDRRPHGAAIAVDGPTFRRDLLFFAVLFAIAVGLGLGAPRPLQLAGAATLVAAYVLYVVLTVRAGSEVASEASLDPLFADPTPATPPPRALILGQLVLGLAAIVGGAHLFVEQLLHVAAGIGIAPLILSLVLAPFATELPEKANSFLWMRQGKDTLALGNVTGAMVFQSSLPAAIGLAFTDWRLGTPSLLAAGLAFGGAALGYVAIGRRARAGPAAVAAWAALYAAFVGYVVVSA